MVGAASVASEHLGVRYMPRLRAGMSSLTSKEDVVDGPIAVARSKTQEDAKAALDNAKARIAAHGEEDLLAPRMRAPPTAAAQGPSVFVFHDHVRAQNIRGQTARTANRLLERNDSLAN